MTHLLILDLAQFIGVTMFIIWYCQIIDGLIHASSRYGRHLNRTDQGAAAVQVVLLGATLIAWIAAVCWWRWWTITFLLVLVAMFVLVNLARAYRRDLMADFARWDATQRLGELGDQTASQAAAEIRAAWDQAYPPRGTDL